MVAGEIFSRANQAKNDGQARAADRLSREEKSANPRPAGALLWSIFLRRAADALVRTDRARPQWPHHRAHAKARQAASDGPDRARLRSRNDRSLLQYRRRHRRRRTLPRKIPQAPHSALPPRLLGKVLFHARQRGLSGFRDAPRARRRLHLLRPSLSRRRALDRKSVV